MAKDGGTSPWVYVLLGCLAVVVLGIGACVGIAYFGVKQLERFGEEMSDPEVRAAKVAEALGTETLPEGYYPVVSFSIPFVMEMAMITDVPPDDSGEPQDLGARGFIFIDSRDFGGDEQDLRDYLEGEKGRSEALERIDFNVDIDRETEIGRGSFSIGETEYVYASHRGGVSTDHEEKESIESMILVDCPGDDSRLRLAIWFGPDPAPETDVAEVDLTGTPADEAAMREFLGYFDLCN